MRTLCAFILTAVGLFGQTAQFPGTILTDQYAGVAKDRSASVLTAGIDASTLSVPVADGTKFTVNQFVTIDDEQMQVCDIVGNTLTICSGTRGFSWTDPAPHSKGAAARGQATAWLPNVLREEVKAIEKHTGPVYNVKGYGAGGLGATDDTVAAQAAVTAACAAGGGTVFFPRGKYKTTAAITLPCAGLVIAGVGPASEIVPATAGMSVFYQTGVSGFPRLQVRDLAINGIDYFPGKNTLKGVHILSQVNGTVENVTCYDVFRCVYIDRCRDIRVRNISLFDNSTIWAGSTIDGYGNVSDNLTFRGIHHYTNTAKLGLDADDAILYLPRAFNATVDDLSTVDLQNVTNGVIVSNNAEGNKLTNLWLVTPLHGVILLRSTIGGTTASPEWTIIDNVNIDRHSAVGVRLDDYCRFTRISKVIMSYSASAPGAGIQIGSGSVGSSISDIVADWIDAGIGINIAAGLTDFTLANNYIQIQPGCTAACYGIVVNTGASDNYAIMNNTVIGPTPANTIVDNGTGVNKQIIGNLPATVNHQFAGDVTISGLSGGVGFVCVDANKKLYRSATACVP